MSCETGLLKVGSAYFCTKFKYIITHNSSGEILVRTSKLSNLAYQPPEQSNIADLLWVQKVLASPELNPTELEKEWLRYIEAQLSLRFEHEIELGEPTYRTSEFDIELEDDN